MPGQQGELRRIGVFTGDRADYAPLLPLLTRLRDTAEVELCLIVSGTHLSPEFGSTWRSIEDDGFSIAERVDMLVSSETAVGSATSMGLALMGVAGALGRVRPDVLVLLGDRYETLAAGLAAALSQVPIAHIGGGQVTEGVIDDSVRHAITKIAHLHFTATADFKRRIVQLGEDASRVHQVGALALDTLSSVRLLSRPELETSLGLPLTGPTFLVTYHPSGPGSDPEQAAGALVEALDAFPDATVVVTEPNADVGRWTVQNTLERYVGARPDRRQLYPALGSSRYLSALAEADAVVGNSSSGLIEAPVLHVPTVNVGDRQTGRPRASSVIDCAETVDGIRRAIETALSPEFRRRAADSRSPYGDGRASERIAAVLTSTDLDQILRKRFVDLPIAP